tara:strand:+ start:656 stop:805 length:150 start_codon:yes stop_codon:yes gene_type:complete
MMTRESIQEEFRQETKEPVFTMSTSEVKVSTAYVIWLENRILTTKTNKQ